MYSAWGSTATLPSARRRKALRAHGGGEGRGHTLAAARLQLVMNASYATHRRRQATPTQMTIRQRATPLHDTATIDNIAENTFKQNLNLTADVQFRQLSGARYIIQADEQSVLGSAKDCAVQLIQGKYSLDKENLNRWLIYRNHLHKSVNPRTDKSKLHKLMRVFE